MSFKVRYYEGEVSYFFDIEKNKNIFENDAVNIGSIFWPADESFVAILNFHMGIDGSGTNSLMVSEWNNPERLRNVFDYGPVQYYPTSRAEKLEDIHIEGSFVYFTAIKENGTKEKFKYDTKLGVLQKA